MPSAFPSSSHNILPLEGLVQVRPHQHAQALQAQIWVCRLPEVKLACCSCELISGFAPCPAQATRLAVQPPSAPSLLHFRRQRRQCLRRQCPSHSATFIIPPGRHRPRCWRRAAASAAPRRGPSPRCRPEARGPPAVRRGSSGLIKGWVGGRGGAKQAGCSTHLWHQGACCLAVVHPAGTQKPAARGQRSQALLRAQEGRQDGQRRWTAGLSWLASGLCCTECSDCSECWCLDNGKVTATLSKPFCDERLQAGGWKR